MAGVARPATKRDENAQASVARPTSVSRAALGARPSGNGLPPLYCALMIIGGQRTGTGQNVQ